MRESWYKDYNKSAEVVNLPHNKNEEREILEEELKSVEKSKRYIMWVQEFSKKVVVITFILYIVNTLFTLWVVYSSYKLGLISGIDTLIVEVNNTFREIVGGYIVKSAVENAVKIGGNYLIGIADAKLKVSKAELQAKYPNIDFNNIGQQNIYEDQYNGGC